MKPLRILWWGRHGNYGPDYPRNRVIIEGMQKLGHQVSRFLPSISQLGHWEAAVRRLPQPDLLWVPCFRQRDLAAAARFARKRGVPLAFDPLISAYDKQVFEREKFAPESLRARRLLKWERQLFSLPDVLIADTVGHARFFQDTLAVPDKKLVVIPVGAEEKLFFPSPQSPMPGQPPEWVFFGTFIGLHGIQHLVEAIGLYNGPPIRWRLLGDGPLRGECESRIAMFQQTNPALDVRFENWRPLAELVPRLREADAFLGIFGTSAKALRVIPNKVYQGLALGKPVLTASTEAFATGLRADEEHGLFWCRPGDPADLAAAVVRLMARRTEWPAIGQAARATYEQHYSGAQIQRGISQTLAQAINSRMANQTTS